METFKISKKEAEQIMGVERAKFPKYHSGLLNTANKYSQATRPNKVGSMNVLYRDYEEETKDVGLKSWEEYVSLHSQYDAHSAAEATFKKIQEIKEALEQITLEEVMAYQKDLVVAGTFIGMSTQQMVIKQVANNLNLPYEMSNTEDESKGIDAYIGDKSYSVKPSSYFQNQASYCEQIQADFMIVYEKQNDNSILVEVSPIKH